MSWLPYLPVLEAAAIIGATSGALGCFAVLRRQSLLGDTLAHAALPGICIAYLLTDSRQSYVLLAGAVIAGVLGTLLLISILNTSRLKQDAAMGIVLSLFFGVGVVLLTYIQGRKGSGKSGLKDFIFGQATYLTQEHVTLTLSFGAAVFAVLMLLYKEFKLLSFDADYASTLGFRRRVLEVLLSILIVIGVMISLKAVGVVLTIALLIAPAAAARQWTHRLGLMMIMAMAFGVLSTVSGAVITANVNDLPTGPVMVLVASVVFVMSVLAAPARGVLWNWLRVQRHRRTVQEENLLSDFYRLGERRRDWRAHRSIPELAAVRTQAPHPLPQQLSHLEGRGYVARTNGDWMLTPAGLDEAARVVRNHRLWELYLARKLELAADHVHRDAEAMEHALPPEIVAELEATLENPDRDPHGLPIPRSG